MELRHLEYFLAVADTGSFTRAAARLHVVQSGVSATIKALERDLGVALFVRHPGGVALTAAGEELRPRAREITEAARDARRAVTAPRGIGGTVTMGTLTSINAIDIPAILAKLHAQHPGISVQLRSATAGTAGLEQQLRDGELDLALLVFTGETPADLRARLVIEAQLVLVVPAGHPLAHRDAVALAELAGLAFVDSPRGYGNRTVVDNAFRAAGIDRAISLEVADVGTIAAHVRNGLGIGFLSEFFLDDLDDLDGTNLVRIPISDAELLWRLYLATAAARPPSAATKALLALLEGAIPERGPSSGPDCGGPREQDGARAR
ncbi:MULTISPECIES: LysR family transcriptional regulator [unclassified Mycobacterium]|uniref:LysR family transcriptional regulator n=1 Tax=unclassified Mycobacterium TaxID=2642494 RepID=UPI000801AD8D|nr:MULTISPECIES: LysR family transcriptional regulator [unclassified Mycobacterium]OBG76689.1 LysR family transcriptional regulator [Mycobacterium sp. E1214]OBH25930.1 LysR family transcriptional regulator [Mycobacterium sp. E1319]